MFLKNKFISQVTYALCMVAGVGGNVITLFTMATADRKNKTVTNVFLISLTVSPDVNNLKVMF